MCHLKLNTPALALSDKSGSSDGSLSLLLGDLVFPAFCFLVFFVVDCWLADLGEISVASFSINVLGL